MDVVSLGALPMDAQERAATLLVEAFDVAWPTLKDALEEIDEALASPTDPDEAPIALAMVDDGAVVGWIGGLPSYDGRVWELHPLVVEPARQGQGIGSALVEALLREVAARGALTVWLGADDESEATSLGGVDLYPDPLAHLQTIEASTRHPLAFYRRLGFVVTGVVPDANGYGKPDILLARRVSASGG